MKRQRLTSIAPVAFVLTAGTLAGQEANGGRVSELAATAEPAGVLDLLRVDARLTEMERTGQIERLPAHTDRQIKGRTQEGLRQFHRGIPVYGSGATRQRDGGATVSIFGRIHEGIDIEVEPRLSPEEALEWMRDLAQAGPLAGPPELVVFPTLQGEYVLAWRSTMRDLRTYFIDAAAGTLLHRQSVKREQQATVGVGWGFYDALTKLSVTDTGERFEAWDRLRPVEVVTLDAGFDVARVDYLVVGPEEGETCTPSGCDIEWRSSVATDRDNEWDDRGVTLGHANLGLTFDYFHQRRGWSGVDGTGRNPIFGIVNAGFQNAFFAPPPTGPEGLGVVAFGAWYGADQTQGGTYGKPFASLDVVAHEVMHGITHYSVSRRTGERFGLLDTHATTLGPASIEYDGHTFTCGVFIAGFPVVCENGRFLLLWNEGGAVNEAFSDIFAAAVEFFVWPPGTGPLQADYTMAEDVFGGGAVERSLENPSGLRLPVGSSYPDAVEGGVRFLAVEIQEGVIAYSNFGLVGLSGDFVFNLGGVYDGVHWNSTIMSHAFYLAIDGGRHASSGRTVTGVGGANRDQIERIFFRAMTELMPAATTFRLTAAVVRQAAVDLYGSGSPPFLAVDEALTAVGL